MNVFAVVCLHRRRILSDDDLLRAVYKGRMYCRRRHCRLLQLAV